MAFAPSPAKLPPRRTGAADPRFLDLFTDDPRNAHLFLAGAPFDGAVIGRKGCKDGPTAIREAMRFLASYDPVRGIDLAGFGIHDLGDIPVDANDVLATHRIVRAHATAAFQAGAGPVVFLGGDNSLSFPHVQALHDAFGGSIGLVVLDAHYDLRPVPDNGIPTSGTPYRRILESSLVKGPNLVEVGIRPYANTKALADYATQNGVRIVTTAQIREWGLDQAVGYGLEKAGDGADHLFLSVDIDGLDQSIASGCSSPGAGGLGFGEAAAFVHAVGSDPRCRGMDLVEVAPNLDPTGNTARAAAQLVAAFAGAVASRGG
jgi:formimidoylglutamase